MTDVEIVKLLGSGGIAVVALVILARIVGKIGDRMILAIDKIGEKVDVFGSKLEDHTRTDVASISELRQDVAVIDGRIQQFQTDWADALTPVTRARVDDAREEPWRPAPEPERHRPAKPERPSGEYSVRPPSERDARDPRRRQR